MKRTEMYCDRCGKEFRYAQTKWADILGGNSRNEAVAKYLAKNNVVPFPVGVGDKVWSIVARGTWGSLITSGEAVERTADELVYDGKIKVHSTRTSMDDPCGNLYAYWGEEVFGTEEEAQKALDAIRSCLGGGAVKKVRVVDINNHVWEYFADEVSWGFDEEWLSVETVETSETILILRISLLAYLEVVE